MIVIMFKYIVLLLCLDAVVSQILNLREGKPCEWQERSGKCALVHKCRSAKNDIKAKNYPPICSFEGKDPIVCCIDCKLTNDTRKEILLHDGWLLGYKIATPLDRKCEKYVDSLDYPCKHYSRVKTEMRVEKLNNCNDIFLEDDISNQTLFDIHKHRSPHVVYLGYGKRLEEAEWLCAGSIISERFILTAAECVLPDPARGQVKYVSVGIHSRSAPDGIFYNVKRAIPHPEYKAPSKYHDIALLETEDPIIFGSNVLPACLTAESDPRFKRNEMYTIIWTEETSDNDDESTSTLDTVEVEEFAELQCQLYYPPQANLTEGYNHTTQMCYGEKKAPVDSCDSVAGFPLQGERIICAQTILGVTSITRQCGEHGSTGLFTRVFYYLPWIESIVWPK